ncbi:Murein hydrolase activator NlpD precursor [Vibrio ruber DSM 16370]|uniref:Murein hydrolase activator NlpD n=1 Tax=Vibrio ruber (strain DSM 16370 / JCM 11486 / BCRC 17186 / CECT 7878 / LMG 23124 / VR1) TaxID=1123498 RepID=A0A1R4LGK5_VIBR1|nr:peptidoglycan DD-metalloendopeptidase family protein [Vibrio ruber]SJN55698.1 Murein hydrolase activator NlpD precursor [Vibrio ruber DSM 16370]
MRSSIRLLILAVLSIYLMGCVATSPAPVSDVKKASRGSYRGSYYQVKKGDTLYFIAYLTDKNVEDLISYNHLSPPYTIYPGQKLHLWKPAYTPPSYGKSQSAAVSKNGIGIKGSDEVLTNVSLKDSKNKQISNNLENKYDKVKKPSGKSIESSQSKGYGESEGKENVNSNLPTTNLVHATKIDRWLWPTKGRVIRQFSAIDQGNKGIDIAGQRGQSVVSSAAGTVVYSGNALRGYGNLVIIKHNDKYLSAYAHNDRLLVSEGQSVKAGQKIATMGSSGTSSVRLHFEIRYQGKPVNPKRYLP